MLEYRRLGRILDIVAGATYTPVKQLCQILGVTDRTLRNDVGVLNETLARHGARVELKRRAGYHLLVDDRAAFDAFLATWRTQAGAASPDLTTADGRFRLLLKTLLESTGFVTAEELADKIAVRESAIQGYVRQAKDVLDRYGIECVSRRKMGFRVFGREEARRDCFANEVVSRRYKSYATGFTADEQVLFDQIDLYRLSVMVKESVRASNIQTTDYGLKNIMVHFALMTSRIMTGSIIESAPETAMPKEVVCFSDDVCDKIERAFGVRVPAAERAYICRHLITNAKVPNDQVDFGWLDGKVDELLDVIARDYGYDLRDDQTLRHGLTSHLSSVFRAIGIGNPVRNPLLNTIKRSFPLQFEIALMSTGKVFSHPPFKLDEDNVGYVTLHKGSAIERRSGGRSDRLRALVVCSFGTAAGTALTQRLQSYFATSVDVSGCISHQDYMTLGPSAFEDISFVVSTVPLTDCPRPSVFVDFALPTNDVKSVSRLVQFLEDDRFGRVKRFFSPDAFLYVEEPTVKDDLLRHMCAQLEEMGAVGDDFLASTLEREKVADTSLNEVFAIPHTMKPVASRTMAAVAVLSRPIRWSEQGHAVQIVFLLAVGTGDQLEMEHLYGLLVRIVEDRHLQQELVGVRDYAGLIDVLSAAV